ncbi:methyltransferase type 11 [Bacillus thuringiensis serovar shandongiensis]|nr:methyltransferase type 11 [Bacillus thuringiensis serovar malayensis]OUB05611.1 methyltransferase type 11 [Bacillus thuringiensis serovar shandongiensis]
MKNNHTPEIRFPGFTGDWEERKLSELMEFSNGINAPKESYGKGRKMISVMDILADEPIVYENIRNSVQVDDKAESKNKVENGDLVFVRSSEIRDEVGWAKAYRQKEYALYSGFSIRGKKKSDFDAKFIELSLNNSNRGQIERQAGGSTRFNVSQSILKSIGILEPSIEEQIEIGNFFKKIDETIALHQQELPILKQTKQGFLQKMFPKEGESVPEVRFPGFTGDWEERKMGEVATFINGRAYKQNELLNSGKYKVLRVGNFYTNNSWYYSDLELGEKYYAEKGDLLYTWSATFGPHIWYGDKVIYHYHIWKVDLSDNLDKQFTIQLLEYDKAKILSDKNGSTMVHITKKGMEEKKVLLPSIEEQIKIGNFFKKLDDTIALHQRELDALKETKKAFLQKMFV